MAGDWERSISRHRAGFAIAAAVSVGALVVAIAIELLSGGDLVLSTASPWARVASLVLMCAALVAIAMALLGIAFVDRAGRELTSMPAVAAPAARGADASEHEVLGRMVSAAGDGDTSVAARALTEAVVGDGTCERAAVWMRDPLVPRLGRCVAAAGRNAHELPERMSPDGADRAVMESMALQEPRVFPNQDGPGQTAVVPLMSAGRAFGLLSARYPTAIGQDHLARLARLGARGAIAIAPDEDQEVRQAAGFRALVDALPFGLGYLPDRWDTPPIASSSVIALATDLFDVAPGAEIRDALEAIIDGVGFAGEIERADKTGRHYYVRVLNVRAPAFQVRVGRLVISEEVTDELAGVLARSRALAEVSHEVRQPMTALLGYIGLAAGEDGVGEDAREYLAIAHRSGQRVMRAVSDLLVTYQADGARVMELDLERCDIAELVADAVEEARISADSAGVSVEFDAQRAEVMAHPSRMLQAVGNVIHNAVKFSPQGAEVLVRVGIDGPRARIEVHDQGPGIPEHERERVFEPFVRGEGAREVPGTGLGLSVVRQVVDAHKGEVGITGAPDAGTLAVISLPLAEPLEQVPSD